MGRPKLKLTLFVKTNDSGQALSQLYRALEFHDYTDYELDIVDILKEPVRATALEIRHAPALIMHMENGDVFMTSDLENIQKIRETFGFKTER